MSAEGCHRSEGFDICIDNGAWTAHQAQRAWNATKFVTVLGKLGAAADFVVLPDIVEGGQRHSSVRSPG